MSKTYAIDFNAVRRSAIGTIPGTLHTPREDTLLDRPGSTVSTESSQTVDSSDIEGDKEIQSLHSLLESTYTVEQSVHPELKALYKRLREGQILRREEKLNFYGLLIQSIKANKPDIVIPEDYKKLPASLEAIAFLRENSDLTRENRNIGAVAANVALAIAEGKPDYAILETLNANIDFYGQTQRPTEDYSRIDIAFRKGDRTFTIRADETASFKSYKDVLERKNLEYELNLTGEQIEYIMRSTDQAGTLGTGQTWKIARCHESGYDTEQIKNDTLIDRENRSITDRSLLVDIRPPDIPGDEQKVLLRACLSSFVKQITDPYAAQHGIILTSVQSDISGLSRDSLRPGLASCEVPTTFIASTHGTDIDFIVPPHIKSADISEDYDHLKEYCRVKVMAQSIENLDTIEKCADFVVGSHAKLGRGLIEAISETRGHDTTALEDMIRQKRIAKFIEFDIENERDNAKTASFLAGKDPARDNIFTGKTFSDDEAAQLIANIVLSRPYSSVDTLRADTTDLLIRYAAHFHMSIEKTIACGLGVAAITCAHHTGLDASTFGEELAKDIILKRAEIERISTAEASRLLHDTCGVVLAKGTEIFSILDRPVTATLSPKQGFLSRVFGFRKPTSVTVVATAPVTVSPPLPTPPSPTSVSVSTSSRGITTK